MTKINTINTEDYNNFFFKEGQEAFNELVKFAEEKSPLVNETLKALKEASNFKDWINGITDNDMKELLNHIYKFVSFCDVNASNNDLGGNPCQNIDEINENIDEIKKLLNRTPNKLTIAKAGVRQDDWVKNMLVYLQSEPKEQPSPSVKNAIEYFQNPKEKFPILSEEHREKIAMYYLNKSIKELENDNKTFDGALKSYFNDSSHSKSKSNLTYAYTAKIYSESSLWNADTTLLEKNHNLILTGAPGTGKTFLARQMAKKLIKNNVDNVKIENKEKDYIGFVQFHPSYDYTDFVEGLRPKSDNGNVVFERVDGVFKEFCKRAANDINNKYVFIIDEINRGEISKIFGELFFSIDPGYRGEKEDQDNTNKVIKVKTQYQNMITEDKDPFKDGFYVPENVYIIGTMNDIDRSVESMDFAFRRRFAFQEITAEESMERILYDLDDSISIIAAEKMGAINKTLNELGLNSNYHIGAAYFMKAKKYCYKYNGEIKCKWDQLWNLHLKGTLFEYFRGEPDANDKLKKLKDAYDNAGEN